MHTLVQEPGMCSVALQALHGLQPYPALDAVAFEE